jgi:hypothetical protein
MIAFTCVCGTPGTRMCRCAALRNDCPVCNAKPGEACVRGNGSKRPLFLVHPYRREPERVSEIQ